MHTDKEEFQNPKRIFWILVLLAATYALLVYTLYWIEK